MSRSSWRNQWSIGTIAGVIALACMLLGAVFAAWAVRFTSYRWERMLADDCTIFLGAAGALSAGGMRLLLAYQRGFGGHFHNDDAVGVLRDIPGLVVASPARPDDAAAMLATCAESAVVDGSVCVFLEPIALYMTRDLHEEGDALWTMSDDALVALGATVAMPLFSGRSPHLRYEPDQIDVSLADVRGLDPPFEVLSRGQTATLVDLKENLRVQAESLHVTLAFLGSAFALGQDGDHPLSDEAHDVVEHVRVIGIDAEVVVTGLARACRRLERRAGRVHVAALRRRDLRDPRRRG